MERPRVTWNTRAGGQEAGDWEGQSPRSEGSVESSGQHSEGLTAVPAPRGPACTLWTRSGPALDPLLPALTFTYAGSLAATV